MTAIGIRFRAELRARWRAWLAVALLAGLAGGLVITAFTGAARTDSALDRLLAVSRPHDVSIAKGFVFQNYDLDFDRIERLPQVVGAARDLPLAALIRTASGEQMYGGHERSVIPLTSPDGSQLKILNRARLRAGRRPDPRSPDEILADDKALEILGVDVGETVRVRFIWKRLLGTPKVDFSADPERAEVGPIATLRIVGVISRTSSDDVSGELRLPPGVYRANGGSALGSFQEILNVQLRHGAADVPAFRTAVERIAGPGDFLFTAAASDRTKVGRSTDLQARALWLAGGFAAVAALILLAQALIRQSDQAAADHPILRAIGMSRSQLVAIGLAHAAVVAAIATAVAVATAIALSPLTPIGRARELEPQPGIAVDGLPLGTGALAILVAVLAVGALAALRTRSSRPPGRRAMGRLSLPPAIQAGLGPAAAARATIVTATVAVAVVAAALVFSASLDRLLTTPRLYGQNWDYEAPFDPSVVPILRSGRPEMPSDRWLGAAAVGVGSSLLINGKQVGVAAFDDVRGHVPPTVVEGRAPRRSDEILLAADTLDALNVQIGDPVEVRRGARAIRLRVVGRGVLPEGEWIKFGEGAALTFEAFKRVVPDAILFFVHLRVRAGAPREASLAAFERHFDWPRPSSPSSIGDFGGVQGMPAVAAFLVVAAAAGALAHALLTSVRHRRRELAILKTLGFVRGQVLAAVAWQASLIMAIALLVGLPLGIALGRFAWNVLAKDIGVLPEPVVPVPATLIVVPASLLLSNLIAAVPARMAAATRPAVALRAE